MKTRYKKILFSFSLLFAAGFSFGQQGQAQYILSSPGPATLLPDDYYARDEVIVQPKLTAIPNSRFYVDKTLQILASYQAGGVNYSNTIPPIDYNLPVGAIAGSGNVTPSGQGTYNIPIVLPPGTNGMTPILGISYHSGASDGLIGRGWNINGLSVITRVPKDEYHDCLTTTGNLNTQIAYYKRGIQLDETDAFALDGMRMIFSTGTYRLANDNFSRITPVPNNASPTHFIVETKDGMRMEYGNTNDSKLIVTNPGTQTQLPLAWHLNKITDKFNNSILYAYDNNTTTKEVVIKEIKYTENTIANIQPYNSVKFYYDIRKDETTRYLLNNALKSTLVLREIEVNCENKFMKRYQFKYGYDSQTFLNEIIEQGSDYTKFNSTFIKYGDNVTQANTVSTTLINTFTPLIPNADYYAGDFNGDGRSDLLAFKYSFISSVGIRSYIDWELRLNDDDGKLYTTPTIPSLPQNFIPYTVSEYFSEWNPSPSGIKTYDLNADGMDDVLIGDKFGSIITFTPYISTGDPSNWFSTAGMSGFFMNDDDKLVLADIDGDARPEAIVYNTNSPSPFKIYFLATGNCALIERVFDENNDPVSGYSGFTPIDFDGDGIQELMTTRAGQKVILKLFVAPFCIGACPEPGGCTSFQPHQSNEIWTEILGTLTLSEYRQSYLGDFNGDGITDIVKADSKYPLPTFNRYAYLSLGTGTGFSNPEVLPGSANFGLDRKYMVADINSDGKSDLIEMLNPPTGIELYVNYGDQTDPLINKTFLGTISGVAFPPNEDYVLNNIDTPPPTVGGDDGNPNNDLYPSNPDDIPEFITGDFAGDGRMDIFFKTNNSGGKRMIAYVNKGSTKQLANTISDGFRSNTDFKYVTMANGGRNVYVKGSGALYPLVDVQMPLYVVKEFSLPDGIGGNNTTTYKYEGANVHLQGKGFLGFDKITASNPVTNRKTESAYAFINPPNAVSSLYEKVPLLTKTFLISPSTPVSEESYTTDFQSIISGCGRALSHFTRTTQVISTDKISGAKVIKDLAYDPSGNITQNLTKITDINNVSNTPPFLETTTVNCNYISAGNWGPLNVMEKCTTTVHRNEDTNPVDYVRIVNNTYDISNGHITQTINDPGKTKRIQTDYSLYDANTGVLKEMTVSDPGSATPTVKTIKYFYDNHSRFITEAKNPLDQSSFAAYDPKWGKPLTEIGIDGLITKYSYDGFGRTKNISTPDNLTAAAIYAWVQPGSLNAADYSATTFGSDVVSNALFSISSQRPGSPASRTIYDILSRELASDVDGFNNKIFSANKYDARGNIFKQCGAYENIPGALVPVVTTNSYNALNQLFKTENAAGTVTNTTDINYFYVNNGTERAETTAPDGKIFKKTTDASGQLISAQDDGGLLAYSYYHNRQLKETKLAGVITNTIEYDEYGRQSKLKEANSGETLYEYDAYGRLTKQTDANNAVTEMQYDVLDRITQKTVIPSAPPILPDTYNYTYITGGNGLNMLQNVSVNRKPDNENISYTYTYDKLNRVTKADENINGPVFSTSFEYDPFSNITKEIYPSGFAIKHTYNTNGYHTQINRNDDGSLIYHTDAMNALGQYTAYTLGNGKQTQKTYTDFGFPLSFTATGVQNMTFIFDQQNGNLASRADVLHGLSETFTYDNSDRLNAVTGPSGLLVNYSSNGNITDKSDATLLTNSYVYDPVKINALVKINKPLNISQFTQNVIYTPFNKARTITEDLDQLDFTYGPNDERKRTVLKNNNIIQQTRYFSGSYEKTISGSDITEVHYINCSAGLVAMYVIPPSGGGGTMYFPYTDHLGSILTVTDEQGNIAAEQSFDAYGRNRHPDDWTYNNIPTVPAWLYRGYTGHEHLPRFALINMNGRMYDPVVGRMLSPDNNLQAPDYSQSHNRYSYVFNNPLKYTDPTGMDGLGYDWMEYGMPYNFASRYDRIALQQQSGTLQAFDWYNYGGKQYNTAEQAYKARGQAYLNYFSKQGIFTDGSFATGYVNRNNPDDILLDAQGVGFSGFRGNFQDAADLFGLNTDPAYKSILRENLANYRPMGINDAPFKPGGGMLDPIDVATGAVAAKIFAGVAAVNVAAKGGGTFYRAMGNAEFAALESSGGLSHMAGKELFVSSSANYSRAYLQKSGYDVLVQFNMKPGAMNYFNQVGVMHRTAAGASGWAGRGSLLWKSEQGVMNLGIQSNTHMFNPWINSFKVIK